MENKVLAIVKSLGLSEVDGTLACKFESLVSISVVRLGSATISGSLWGCVTMIALLRLSDGGVVLLSLQEIIIGQQMTL